MNTIITSAWDTIIQYFFPVFSVPTTVISLNLVPGFIFCAVKHTITSILPFSYPTVQKSHYSYHRFFPYSFFVKSELCLLVSTVLFGIFYATVVILTDLDDTLFDHSVLKVDC
jgi:hypothetical protein